MSKLINIDEGREQLYQVLRDNVDEPLMFHWQCKDCEFEQATESCSYDSESTEMLINDGRKSIGDEVCRVCDEHQTVYHDDIIVVEILPF